MKIRKAYLADCKINEMFVVAFFEREYETETTWTAHYKTKEEALRAIRDFKETE